MDADAVLEAVRDDRETELSRLGSSKSLYAATGGEMEAEAVLSAVADRTAAGRDRYREWADQSEGAAADLFAAVADVDTEQYETLTSDLEAHDPAPDSRVDDALAGCSNAVERVGGLLGETLVREKTLEQTVAFFVGDADPRTAGTIRDLRAAVQGRLDDVVATLDEVCADDGDVDRAREAADAVVGAAYDEYVANLEAMGVNPKPVC